MCSPRVAITISNRDSSSYQTLSNISAVTDLNVILVSSTSTSCGIGGTNADPSTQSREKKSQGVRSGDLGAQWRRDKSAIPDRPIYSPYNPLTRKIIALYPWRLVVPDFTRRCDVTFKSTFCDVLSIKLHRVSKMLIQGIRLMFNVSRMEYF